jgi:hypothetical protein
VSFIVGCAGGLVWILSAEKTHDPIAVIESTEDTVMKVLD